MYFVRATVFISWYIESERFLSKYNTIDFSRNSFLLFGVRKYTMQHATTPYALLFLVQSQTLFFHAALGLVLQCIFAVLQVAVCNQLKWRNELWPACALYNLRKL